MFAPATNTTGFQGIDGLVQFFARIGAVLAGAQEAHRVYHHLSRLPDSELAARGLTREDIGRMTLQALNNASGE